jgi:glycosyltransferase involved in cell wall biosynthesis
MVRRKSIRGKFVQKISACIITNNDEHIAEWSISSVRWADEIVVVDTGSTDRTIEIAQSLGARVVHTEPFAGFGAMRNRAISFCSHDWVFSLDADEHCTQGVRDEIVAMLAGTSAHDAYFILRYNYFMGRWIKGSGWYRDHRTPQLFRKSRFRYSASLSHEAHELDSDRPVGMLKTQILHFPFGRLEEVLKKANLYSSLGADAMAGRRVSMWSALAHGVWAFLRMYVLRRGFVDGWPGFIIAMSNFEGTFYRYAKCHERAQGYRPPSESTAPPHKA